MMITCTCAHFSYVLFSLLKTIFKSFTCFFFWKLSCSHWFVSFLYIYWLPVFVFVFNNFILFFFINLFYLLFLAALGLRCYTRAFSSCGMWGLFFVAVRGLLIAVASLVAEHRLQARGLQQLWHVGSVVVACGLQSEDSVVVAPGLNCSAACGSSRTRAQTHVPCIGRWILNHCATREAPVLVFFFLFNHLFLS